MEIRDVTVERLKVPFREPLRSGAQRWLSRRLALLHVVTDSGLVGVGEVAWPSPEGGKAPAAEVLMTSLRGLDLEDDAAIRSALEVVEHGYGRAVRAAVESAVLDAQARAQGSPVASMLVPSPAREVLVNGLLGVGPADAVAAEAVRQVIAGYTCLKLKGGGEPAGEIVERVAQVRSAVGPGVALRLDLNGTLDEPSAAGLAEHLAPFELEYLEQPIPAALGASALARFRARSPIGVAADEGASDAAAVTALIDAGAADVLVLKPARVGGLRSAREIIVEAVRADVGVVLSTLYETGVGIAGALQLAATVPGTRAHGLATADLLASDLLASPIRVEGGRIAVPRAPGLGVELDRGAVETYRR